MAKKDTYLALLRRGVDETTAMTLADSGLKIGDIKKLDQEQLVQNYGLKAEIARSVLEVLQSGSTKAGKERYLSNVLSGDKSKKPMDKIEEQRFKRQQKDILLELQEQRERLKLAKVEQFRSQKVVMNRLGKTIELIVKLENNFDDKNLNSNLEKKSTFEDLPMDINSSSLIDAETYSIHDTALDSNELNVKTLTDENTLSYPKLISKKNSVADTSEVETSPLIPEWANQTDNPAFFQNLDIPTFLRKLGSNRPRQ